MSYVIAESRNVKFSSQYNVSAGLFAIAVKYSQDRCTPSSWYSCREEFHSANQRSRDMFFTCVNVHKVAEFINKIEIMLKIPEQRRTLFATTSRNNILWIRVSRWWRRYSIRRSLFTILLRATKDYDGSNFKKVLRKAQYLDTTQLALNRFFKGYTKCTRQSVGWYHTFYWSYHLYDVKLSKKEVRELLVKP